MMGNARPSSSALRRFALPGLCGLLALGHAAPFRSGEGTMAPTGAGVSEASGPAKVRILKTYTGLPRTFEVNRGQSHPQVKFVSRGADHTLFLASGEAVLALHEAPSPRSRIPAGSAGPRARAGGRSGRGVTRMSLLRSRPRPRLVGRDELPGTVNYFLGRGTGERYANIPTFAAVAYEGVYPGVDWVFHGDQNRLEFDCVVAPGADPGAITLAFKGPDGLALDEGGDLLLHLPDIRGTLRLRQPLAYQVVGGERRGVPAAFVLRGRRSVGFKLAAFDPQSTLVIDPVLVYATYFGGSGSGSGIGVAVDSAGNAFLTGNTRSVDFPTVNPAQPSPGGGADAFVSKLSADGSSLVYSTFLGGSRDDQGAGIDVDSTGNAYVTGYTESPDFPTLNALQPAFGGFRNVFVAKLDATGSRLVYSTYLGGGGSHAGEGIAVDAGGQACVTGFTSSFASSFPTVNALQPVPAGGWEAFVAKLNAAGSALVYSTYLGGSGDDQGFGIAVDAPGNAYVTGTTASSNFPTSVPLQPAFGGVRDAFVAKLSGDGSALTYATFLGGGGEEQGRGIAVDGASSAHVTGFTASSDFPTLGALQPVFGGVRDAFVAALVPSGSALVYATYLGGANGDEGRGVALGGAGGAIVSGCTLSSDFPTVNAVQPSFHGGGFAGDAFVARLNSPGSALVYSTYLGGSGDEQGRGIAADGVDDSVVTGFTNSPDFPVFNALQPTFGQGFVAKITEAFPVGVDILPGEDPNTIDPQDESLIPVGILSSPTFDAPGGVDRTSLTFGRTGSEQSLWACESPARDVNNDGLSDLVCRFSTGAAGFLPSDRGGILKGRRVDAQRLVGWDSIRIRQRSGGRTHRPLVSSEEGSRRRLEQ